MNGFEMVKGPSKLGDAQERFIPKTRAEARRERHRVKKRLKKHGPTQTDRHLVKACAALVEKLSSCRPRRPCKSGACPMCLLSYQRFWVRATGAYLQELGTPMAMVTCVPGTVRSSLAGQ